MAGAAALPRRIKGVGEYIGAAIQGRRNPQAEVEAHMKTHIQFTSWWHDYVMGRHRDDRPAVPGEHVAQGVPVIEMADCFARFEAVAILSLRSAR